MKKKPKRHTSCAARRVPRTPEGLCRILSLLYETRSRAFDAQNELEPGKSPMRRGKVTLERERAQKADKVFGKLIRRIPWRPLDQLLIDDHNGLLCVAVATLAEAIEELRKAKPLRRDFKRAVRETAAPEFERFALAHRCIFLDPSRAGPSLGDERLALEKMRTRTKPPGGVRRCAKLLRAAMLNDKVLKALFGRKSPGRGPVRAAEIIVAILAGVSKETVIKAFREKRRLFFEDSVIRLDDPNRKRSSRANYSL